MLEYERDFKLGAGKEYSCFDEGSGQKKTWKYFVTFAIQGCGEGCGGIASAIRPV